MDFPNFPTHQVQSRLLLSRDELTYVMSGRLAIPVSPLFSRRKKYLSSFSCWARKEISFWQEEKYFPDFSPLFPRGWWVLYSKWSLFFFVIEIPIFNSKYLFFSSIHVIFCCFEDISWGLGFGQGSGALGLRGGGCPPSTYMQLAGHVDGVYF